MLKKLDNCCVFVTLTILLLQSRVVIYGSEPSTPPSPEKRMLSVRLLDAETGEPVAGIVRVARAGAAQPLRLSELIPRKNGWYTAPSAFTVEVPAGELTVTAVRGIEMEAATATVPAGSADEITLRLKRFSNARQRGWRSGNTHLHLMKLTRAEAEDYLRKVPESDDLELVYLSHLRRVPDESTYVSNEIVEESLTGDILTRLSTDTVLLRPGEEHRHNFGRGGEGFGHVMLLDIDKLVRPVSIGPGIMRSGSDSRPLRTGIDQARSDGATVVWCHNSFGFEDIPNWVSGNLHAQNIFDGGSRGSYDASFYRYLNLGLAIPFSTGTDWFIDDFSRVYVPLRGPLNSAEWLRQLREGRSFITNGPVLEFGVDGQSAGHRFDCQAPTEFDVCAKAVGRVDFRALQLIRNGEVIAESTTTSQGGHYAAELNLTLRIDEPSWLAVRTPPDGPDNEFGRPVYAHFSPIYFDFQGRRPFRKETALELIVEIEESLQVIREKAVFADNAEDAAVMRVYREGIDLLKKRVTAHSE